MQNNYITVTQLTKYIKFKIDTDEHLGTVFLRGEISNFKAHTRGHYYFTLKDENTRINAVMFSSATSKCKFMPQDGMTVLVTGKVSVYEATGGYQIYVQSMTEDGLGNLYIAFEQLKEKLEKEGLFASNRKKPLPKFPMTIGIITAPTGAAIRDILSTIQRRFPLANTILFPSLVQGASAAPDIVNQIKTAETYPLDLLIIGRGGGSIEDMWCFNDETVARTIAACPIPTISAVGHEIDYTIADFVADLRAPTPTGAAEMAVPHQKEVLDLIIQLKHRVYQMMRKELNQKEQQLINLVQSYILKNPMSMYEIKEQKLDLLLEQLISLTKRQLTNARSRLEKSTTSYLLLHPERLYLEKKHQFLEQYRTLKKVGPILIEKPSNQFGQLLGKLETLNPLLTMKRGYTIIYKEDHVVPSSKQLKKGESVVLRFQDGDAKAEVKEVTYATTDK